MKKVLLFAVVFSCSMWANAQRVTWATEAGLSAIQRTGYGECWRYLSYGGMRLRATFPQKRWAESGCPDTRPRGLITLKTQSPALCA